MEEEGRAWRNIWKLLKFHHLKLALLYTRWNENWAQSRQNFNWKSLKFLNLKAPLYTRRNENWAQSRQLFCIRTGQDMDLYHDSAKSYAKPFSPKVEAQHRTSRKRTHLRTQTPIRSLKYLRRVDGQILRISHRQAHMQNYKRLNSM